MIKTPTPNFNSNLTDVIMSLENIRGHGVSGTTRPEIFLQLKQMLHLIEALASARIEGNRTTLASYISRNKEHDDEKIKEIQNLIRTLSYIDAAILDGEKIDKQFILKIQKLVVDELVEDGDEDAGSWRKEEVRISKSEHIPPSHYDVLDLMDELIDYINSKTNDKYNLLKIAVVHHRFVWIHPFNNGNGRTARLLTYAMLCKMGYIIPNDVRLFSPTSVFACNRKKYYEMLSKADSLFDSDVLDWCDYMLTGILDEIKKSQKLANREFVNEKLLIPAVQKLQKAGLISILEYNILIKAIHNEVIKAADIKHIWNKEISRTTVSKQISKLKNSGLLLPTSENGKEYTIGFIDSNLTRLVLEQMNEEDMLPMKVDGITE